MIDIKKILEDKEATKRALSKRLSEEEFDLDRIEELDRNRRELQHQFDTKRAEQNKYNDKMASIDKGSQEFKDLLEELKKKSEEVKKVETDLREAEKELTLRLEVLPNLPDEDVPAGGKENNEDVKTVGEKPTFEYQIKDHVQLAEDLGLLDLERASKISGSNFSMYTGMGARLEWALINFFIDEHIKAGYEMIIPPNLVVRESAYTAGQLPKFEDDVYWTKEGLCLIPTAETVLTNIYRDEILDENSLPQKFFAYTPCYRKEAGSYRANEKGLIRMHQFNKVEMYQFTTEEKSEEALEELREKAENLVEKLGLHYKTVKLAAGDCSAAAAKTYDVEVWIPAIEQYYEVSSISNVRDYQARRGNMRYRTEDGEIRYLHTLNASGLATSRLMVAILETYQKEDGSIVVPKVLRKYIGGIKKIDRKN
ncbi:MAG: Serine--tRNA ligase [candidate division WS6 bacterium 36_33]|uniref:Serine--tRNA ligase n=1 Tax=candidate division WS6 bacterium 36_33 TaxID=1641388 RepID=A0A101GZG9_9BACT|nr:MAG: Serine--tRNA ligase [candidate division WS6 bacterium 36_33]